MTDRIHRANLPTFVPAQAESPAMQAKSGPVMQRPGLVNIRDVPFSIGRAWPFWIGSGCAKTIGWLAREAPPAVDVTPQFDALNKAARSGANVLPANAADFVYLCVGGIFSHHFLPSLYLQENIDALRKAGLSADRIAIDSTAGVRENARVVRDAVIEVAAATGKKVVLIGHSKGGLDAAAALALYPEVAAQTHALVTLQSPYAGSPVAQDIADDPVQKGAGNFLLQSVFGGKPAMASDLTYTQRREFLHTCPLPEDLNVVSLATVDTAWVSSTAAAGSYIRHRYALESDGVVVPADALLPNSRAIVIRGLDHMSSISPTHQRLRYTPASLTLAAVAVALSPR